MSEKVARWQERQVAVWKKNNGVPAPRDNRLKILLGRSVNEEIKTILKVGEL